jgi:hypothetical protein
VAVYRAVAETPGHPGGCRNNNSRRRCINWSWEATIVRGHTNLRHSEARGGRGGNTATSLYERLGGIYNIATVVDDFIDRIMVDERLNANPRVDEAHHRVLPPGFRYLVAEQVGEATGGPQRYTGRSMEDSIGIC